MSKWVLMTIVFISIIIIFGTFQESQSAPDTSIVKSFQKISDTTGNFFLVKCSARSSEFRWKLPNYREIKQNINPDELHRLSQGRFHMFDISSGNLSLLINNLTEKDEGLYSCWTHKNQHKIFSLTVKGKEVINSHIN